MAKRQGVMFRMWATGAKVLLLPLLLNDLITLLASPHLAPTALGQVC